MKNLSGYTLWLVPGGSTQQVLTDVVAKMANKIVITPADPDPQNWQHLVEIELGSGSQA